MAKDEIAPAPVAISRRCQPEESATRSERAASANADSRGLTSVMPSPCDFRKALFRRALARRQPRARAAGRFYYPPVGPRRPRLRGVGAGRLPPPRIGVENLEFIVVGALQDFAAHRHAPGERNQEPAEGVDFLVHLADVKIGADDFLRFLKACAR